MRASSRRTALLAACAALAITASLPELARARTPHAAADTEAHAYTAERVRIRAHFDSVLVELRAAPVAHLSASQRAARADRIAELQRYRDRGVFPHNHDFADAWTPYFVDHRGVRCAVAHLLDASGRGELVTRVARADNNVWVPRLEGDRAFAAWLDESGLTLAEAARIQVPYIGTPPEEPAAARADNRTNTAAAIVAGTVGVTSALWNLRAGDGRFRRVRAALGLGAGALGVAVAVSRRDAEGGALAVGLTTGAIGIGSAAMGVHAWRSHAKPAPLPTSSARAAEPVTVAVSPAMVSTGTRVQPGVSMSVRF